MLAGKPNKQLAPTEEGYQLRVTPELKQGFMPGGNEKESRRHGHTRLIHHALPVLSVTESMWTWRRLEHCSRRDVSTWQLSELHMHRC